MYLRFVCACILTNFIIQGHRIYESVVLRSWGLTWVTHCSRCLHPSQALLLSSFTAVRRSQITKYWSTVPIFAAKKSQVLSEHSVWGQKNLSTQRLFNNGPKLPDGTATVWGLRGTGGLSPHRIRMDAPCISLPRKFQLNRKDESPVRWQNGITVGIQWCYDVYIREFRNC